MPDRSGKSDKLVIVSLCALERVESQEARNALHLATWQESRDLAYDGQTDVVGRRISWAASGRACELGFASDWGWGEEGAEMKMEGREEEEGEEDRPAMASGWRMEKR